MKNYLDKINKEIKTAEDSISSGNLGRARVCARRIVGFAIREKLNLIGKPFHAPDLKKLIAVFINEVECSQKVQDILDHMTWKVEMNEETKTTYWPYPEINLLNEAKWFANEILSN